MAHTEEGPQELQMKYEYPRSSIFFFCVLQRCPCFLVLPPPFLRGEQYVWLNVEHETKKRFLALFIQRGNRQLTDRAENEMYSKYVLHIQSILGAYLTQTKSWRSSPGGPAIQIHYIK